MQTQMVWTVSYTVMVWPQYQNLKKVYMTKENYRLVCLMNSV